MHIRDILVKRNENAKRAHISKQNKIKPKKRKNNRTTTHNKFCAAHRCDVMWCVDTVNVYCAYWMIEPTQIWYIFVQLKLTSSAFEASKNPLNIDISLQHWNIDKEKWIKVKKGTKIQTWHTKNCPFQVFAATIGFTLRFFLSVTDWHSLHCYSSKASDHFLQWVDKRNTQCAKK